MRNNIYLVLAFTFNIYFLSGFSIHKTYPNIGHSKPDWGLGIQDRLSPQDTEQLLLEEVFGLLHGRDSFSGMPDKGLKEMRGLSITIHQQPGGAQGESDQRDCKEEITTGL